jgi:hypothetical protein
MATTIKLKNSVTATNAPSSLVQGEVAINVTDKKVWVGNAATTPVQLLGTGATGNFSALTCTTLTASGVATFSAGAVGTPAITTTGDTNTGIFFPAADTIAFTEGGVESMRIDSSGNVGIGTSSPLTPLHVVGAIQSQRSGAAQYARMLNSTGTATFISDNQASATYTGFQFQGLSTASGTPVTYATIDGSGNVGIGTSSPANTLDINSSSNYVARFQNSSNQSLYFYSGSNLSGLVAESTGQNGILFNSDSDFGYIFTDGSEKMRITSSGNLLVGTTTGMGGGGGDGIKGVQAGGGNPAQIIIQNSSDANIYLAKVSGYTSGNLQLFYVNNSLIGSISTNGSNTTYSTSSDYRLKEDIAPLTNALAKVAQLKPVTYKWKSTGKESQGFIAHELQSVIPEAVVGEKDAIDSKGNPHYQGIDTSFLVATLTAAIQEQQALIENLTTRLNALEGN